MKTLVVTGLTECFFGLGLGLSNLSWRHWKVVFDILQGTYLLRSTMGESIEEHNWLRVRTVRARPNGMFSFF